MIDEKILLRELVDLQNRYLGDIGGDDFEDFSGKTIDVNNEPEANRYLGKLDGWIDCLSWVLKITKHPYHKKYE
jgi:hypothetical protein